MDNFLFARRTNWPKQSNALNEAFENLRNQGVDVMDLTASNPTNCGFSYPPDLLTHLDSLENFHYTPDARGLEEARKAVADYYARSKIFVPPQDIILTASTSEAYSFLMRLLVNPGEKILIPRPSYPLFQFLLEINDVGFEQYPLEYNGAWRLDFEALERLVDTKTRAIILVNPNNPTGSYISRAELNHLNEFCRKHHLAIISDEVFYDFVYEKGDFLSLSANPTVLTFALGGLSKTLGLPQMKCAWILTSGPAALVQEALARLEIITDTYLSVNTPVQNALKTWLPRGPAIQGQIMARTKENWQWLKTHVNANAELLSLQGGWYATLRIPATKSEEKWALEFLQEDKVLVFPGYFFDFEKEAYIVISLLPAESVFQKAMGKIFSRLAKL